MSVKMKKGILQRCCRLRILSVSRTRNYVCLVIGDFNSFCGHHGQMLSDVLTDSEMLYSFFPLHRDTSTSTQARGTSCAPSAPNASGRPVSSNATKGSTPERNPTSASFATRASPSATRYADTPNANTLTTK